MILGPVLDILAAGAKAFSTWVEERKRVAAEDRGRALQRGDDQKAILDDTQKIHDARNDPAVAERLREQSLRD